MAQVDAIEASARELISKLPEEILEEEERGARKEGNSFISFVFKPSLYLQINV